MNREEYLQEEHPITLALAGPGIQQYPMGYARGWDEFRTRGRSDLYIHPTVWPKSHITLTAGASGPYNYHHGLTETKGLFYQEAFVLLKELNKQVEKFLHELHFYGMMPRQREHYSVDPKPEDFELREADLYEWMQAKKGTTNYFVYDGTPVRKRMPPELLRTYGGKKKTLDEYAEMLRKKWIGEHRIERKKRKSQP